MEVQQPGIQWDPREPPPPDIQRSLDLEREVSRAQRRRPRDLGQASGTGRRRPQDEYINVQISHPRGSHWTAETNRDFGDQSRSYDSVEEPNRRSEGRVHDGAHANDALGGSHADGFLPPIAASIRAQLVHDTAQVDVTHLFHNDTGLALPRASYTFPLPHGCTVVGFSYRIGRDRVLQGRVKPKREAREAFERATSNGETAGLLDEQTPEIFTATLGNIPARARLKFSISYIVLLKYDYVDGSSGLTAFTLPVYIAPRFGTPSPGLVQALGTSASLNSLSIEVDVLAPEAISSVTCPSHPDAEIEVGAVRRACQTWREFAQSQGQRQDPDPRTAFIRLPEMVAQLDRDFVVEIRTQPEAGLETPQACLERHPQWDGHTAVMLTIPPRLMLGTTATAAAHADGQGEIIFVADRSGSMEDKIAALRSAMEFFLKGIPTGRSFNIHCFGSNHESLWARPTAYSANTLQTALGYVSKHFRADMDGTRLLPALKAAVAGRDRGRTTDVVVLTDGEVWDLDETLRFVREARAASENRLRFFALGIGAAVSHALVEGIARLSGGYAEVIPAASSGGWNSRVVAVLEAALTGHIGPISVDVEVRGSEEVQHVTTGERSTATLNNYANSRLKMMQSPAAVSAVSPFLRNRVFFLFESLPSAAHLSCLRLRATRPSGEEIIEQVPIRVLSVPGTAIHKLAARALLGDLERGQSIIHLADGGPTLGSLATQKAVMAEGERLGCKWDLVSKWTSFYATEDRFQPPPYGDTPLDPFLYGSDPGIEVVTQGEPGLLRARATTNNVARRLAAGLTGRDESDEDTDESEEGEEFPADFRDDSTDDDDGNSDGNGGPAGYGGAGASGGNLPRPGGDHRSGGNPGHESSRHGGGNDSGTGPAATGPGYNVARRAASPPTHAGRVPTSTLSGSDPDNLRAGRSPPATGQTVRGLLDLPLPQRIFLDLDRPMSRQAWRPRDSPPQQPAPPLRPCSRPPRGRDEKTATADGWPVPESESSTESKRASKISKLARERLAQREWERADRSSATTATSNPAPTSGATNPYEELFGEASQREIISPRNNPAPAPALVVRLLDDDDDDDDDRRGREYINLLLQHQEHDGSFRLSGDPSDLLGIVLGAVVDRVAGELYTDSDPGRGPVNVYSPYMSSRWSPPSLDESYYFDWDYATGSPYLGHSHSPPVPGMSKENATKLVMAAAIIVLLEWEFPRLSRLWRLMAAKAERFVNGADSNSGGDARDAPGALVSRVKRELPGGCDTSGWREVLARRWQGRTEDAISRGPPHEELQVHLQPRGMGYRSAMEAPPAAARLSNQFFTPLSQAGRPPSSLPAPSPPAPEPPALDEQPLTPSQRPSWVGSTLGRPRAHARARREEGDNVEPGSEIVKGERQRKESPERRLLRQRNDPMGGSGASPADASASDKSSDSKPPPDIVPQPGPSKTPTPGCTLAEVTSKESKPSKSRAPWDSANAGWMDRMVELMEHDRTAGG